MYDVFSKHFPVMVLRKNEMNIFVYNSVVN